MTNEMKYLQKDKMNYKNEDATQQTNDTGVKYKVDRMHCLQLGRDRQIDRLID